MRQYLRYHGLKNNLLKCGLQTTLTNLESFYGGARHKVFKNFLHIVKMAVVYGGR